METLCVTDIQRCALNRLYAIGVPTYISQPLVADVCRWLKCSGPEWTVSRLKSVKLYMIQIEAGLKPSPPPWIKLNRKGELSGPLGMLLRWLHGSPRRKRKRFNQVVNALGIYTLLVNTGEPTDRQFTKFISGVDSARPLGLSPQDYESYLFLVRSVIPSLSIDRSVDNSLLTYRGSPNKRAPKLVSEGSIPQDSDICQEMAYASIDYQTAWRFNALYQPVVAGLNGPRFRPNKVEPHSFVGEVHFLQEPGFKLRAIASPYRIHQLALRPIGVSLYSLLKSLPWDCTHDQSKPFPIVQGHLQSSKVVHSVDLSGATDYFPLELQLATLREIYGDVLDIELIEFLSRAPFRSRKGPISWKHGQPLGLYPSFAMFGLTHGLLLLFCNNGRHEDKFFIVGDDVIILDDTLYHRYTSILNNLGCPWSKEKSISSSSLCEFAGKIITKDSVVAQYKWRRMSDDSFLDICRALGPRSRNLLTPRQKRVFDAVKHLQPPLGLNFSGPGTSLASSILETEKFLREHEERMVRSLVDLSEVVNRNLYHTSEWDVDHSVIRAKLDAFDEKVVRVYRQTVIGRLTALRHAFDDIPQALGIEPRLPAKSVPPSRETFLSRFMRLFKL